MLKIKDLFALKVSIFLSLLGLNAALLSDSFKCECPIKECEKNPSNWLSDCGFESGVLPNAHWAVYDDKAESCENNIHKKNSYLTPSPTQGMKSFMYGFEREESNLHLCQKVDIKVRVWQNTVLMFDYRYGYDFQGIRSRKSFNMELVLYKADGNRKESFVFLSLPANKKHVETSYQCRRMEIDTVDVSHFCFTYDSQEFSMGEFYVEIDNVVLMNTFMKDESITDSVTFVPETRVPRPIKNPGKVYIPDGILRKTPGQVSISQNKGKCVDFNCPSGMETFCSVTKKGDISLIKCGYKGIYKEIISRNSNDQNGIKYNCNCEPECSSESTGYSCIGLKENIFSRLEKGVLRYCMAVRATALRSSLSFRNDGNQEILDYYCPDTENIDSGVKTKCNGWFRQTDPLMMYNHPCYVTYCVDAIWENLSKNYKTNMNSEFMNEVHGVTYVKSLFHKNSHILNSNRLWFGCPQPWTVKQTIKITGGIKKKIVSNGLILDNTVLSSFLLGFSQGFENDGLTHIAKIEFDTLVQKPYCLSLVSVVSKGLKNDEITFSQVKSSLSLYKNEIQNNCLQRWSIRITPGSTRCRIDEDLTLTFYRHCDHEYKILGLCEDGAYEKVIIPYESADWCAGKANFQYSAPKAKISFTNCDDCNCETSKIYNNKDNRANLQINIEGNQNISVATVKLESVDISTNCDVLQHHKIYGNLENAKIFSNFNEGFQMKTVPIYSKGHLTSAGNVFQTKVDQHPRHSCIQGANPDSSVTVSFNLNKVLFNPPNNGECQLEIEAILEVDYARGKKRFVLRNRPEIASKAHTPKAYTVKKKIAVRSRDAEETSEIRATDNISSKALFSALFIIVLILLE